MFIYFSFLFIIKILIYVGCTCYLPGTLEPERGSSPCESTGGECRCKANVVGRRCDKCRKGFWNIDSGEGCSACNCNRIGSVNQTCDIRSGQCHCQPGVIGRHCDSCAPYHYGFSEEGCKGIVIYHFYF